MSQPRFACRLSRAPTAREAVREATSAVLDDLDGAEVTLAVVFATPELLVDGDVLVDAIGEALAPRHLLGCTAEATIAEGREIVAGPR